MQKDENYQVQIVCSFGIIGMILCITLIGFSTIGMAAAAISITNQSNMNMMYDNSDSFVDKMMRFFDSTTGMTVLLVSFASMIVGMWYRKKTRLIPVAAIGAVFMLLECIMHSPSGYKFSV